MNTNCACVLILWALSGCLSSVNAMYGGTCNTYYGLNATTCSEVVEACGSSSTCSSTNGDISYYCHELGCSGTWTNVCSTGYFHSCEEADSELLNIGCECSKCYNDGDSIYASCYYPFNCSVRTYGGLGGDTDYRVLIYVYFGTVAVLVLNAILASFCCAPKQNGELSTKEVVQKKLSCIGRGIYRLVLGSFVLEDGSSMQFLDYVSDKRNLFGVIHCRKTSAKLRPRWMRLGAFVAALLVTISLSFVFGTRVYNAEICTYSQDTCDGVPMAVECLAGSGELYFESYWMIAVVSLAVSEASALSVNSVRTRSLWRKLQLAVTLLIAAGLVIFGVFFSDNESKGEVGDDYNGDSRRLETIGFFLLIGWALSEVVGLGLAIFRFVSCWICYDCGFRSRLQKARKKKSAEAAVIYPQSGQKLDHANMEAGTTSNPIATVEADGQKAADVTSDATSTTKAVIGSGDNQNPKPMIETETGLKSVTAANSSKAKSVDHLDAGKQKSSRLDRPRALTENIKLEPPKRGDQQ